MAFTDKIKLEGLDEKRAAENILIAKIFIYSAIKIKANKPLPYSILNPDTSSDSPSARSKGVRLVSASIVINQIIKIGEIIRSAHTVLLNVLLKENLW